MGHQLRVRGRVEKQWIAWLIAGIQGKGMTILDPASGESFVEFGEFGEFPGTYFGGATLDGYAFTKP